MQSSVIYLTIPNTQTSYKKVKELVSIPNGYKIAQVTYIVDGSESSNYCLSNIIGLDSTHSDDNIVVLLKNMGTATYTWRLSVKVLAIKE